MVVSCLTLWVNPGSLEEYPELLTVEPSSLLVHFLEP